jgi:vacuolar-type H+-ATPase subunit H
LAKQAEKEVSEAESLPEKLRTAMNDMASTQYQEVLAQLSNTQTELRKNYDKNARSAFSAAKRLINESHKNYGKKFDM